MAVFHCVCVRACVRACVRVCVCACVRVCVTSLPFTYAPGAQGAHSVAPAAAKDPAEQVPDGALKPVDAQKLPPAPSYHPHRNHKAPRVNYTSHA